MELFNLGKVAWHETQLIYHALAELNREALSLVSPASPYVCIGYHQDVAQEVDLEFCRQNEIPVFRRKVGGGAVYLDGEQLFFHLILHKNNAVIPPRKETFYKKFLQPVVDVYRHIGIAAEYKPINDVIVQTRKISGTGVGEIGDCVVFVGNLIVDFNYDMMARVLKVPDEKFRDKVHKTLKDNLSTIHRELGAEQAAQWNEFSLNRLMAQEFQKIVGPLAPSNPDEELRSKMDQIGQKLINDEWLFQSGRRLVGRDIKIRAGVKLIHKMHKATGGLIRADFELSEGKVANLNISGDFFCFPGEAVSRLESRLEGQSMTDAKQIIEAFYTQESIETPGIEIDDWMRVLTV